MSEPIRAAAIVGGVVVNVEVIEPGFKQEGITYVPSETAGIGDRYEGGAFVPAEPEAPTVSSADVDAERDRRISDGFEFEGKRYQSRAKDRENILGAASLAHMALTIGGKSPTDPKWHGGDSDFVWIAEDNSLVPMTAPKVIEFGRVAAEHKSAHTFAARALKSVETPSDYTDSRYWP